MEGAAPPLVIHKGYELAEIVDIDDGYANSSPERRATQSRSADLMRLPTSRSTARRRWGQPNR
jgi:hypothetical protein